MSVKGVQESDIDRMNHTIRHRGPDDSGIFINREKTVGLGHRRLSIIDLGSGHQPMSNEDDTHWITFNGEIYNYQELRKDLGKRHEFKSQSDTEVILHLYEEKEEGCLQYLRGMFAFAIYDLQKKKLFMARDHLGQKPLYYYHDGDTFAFASEIKALLALKPELRELDPNALYEYLTIRIITPPRSMFRKIRKLPPGHFLTFQDGKVSIRRYWHLKYEPKIAADFDTVSENLEEQLLSTVKYHLVSDVPVGAFLSGGMDSSLIVAMMSKASGERIKTFSGDVPYENYSELPYAKMVSDKYKTEHHELTIIPSLVQTLPDLIWYLDEPSDPLSVCMYCISELARRDVKVVLGGDGGDELFGGYDRYYGNVLVSYYAIFPEYLRKHIFEKLINLVPEGFWYQSFSHKLKWMHQMSFYNGGDRYAKSLSYFYFSDGYKNRLYTDKFRKSVHLFDPEACIKDYFDSDNATEVIDKMLHSDSMVRMPDHPNMVLDRMTMAHGLEARSPFLDHKLAEFCASIPPQFKVRGTKRRYIQVELAKKYLPPALITKKKQGFSSPLTYLLADEFRLLYKVFLNDSSLVRDGYLNHSAINTLLYEHINKKVDHGNRLWLLCNAEVWYRMCIENESIDTIKELLNSRAASLPKHYLTELPR
ncbi:MAG: asparagine synthase (glutamine-hydrolyzing) [Deltaproteobacteria bacterium]|nr:asparagine synthase (glutamine-hydrolyzing) [Deltaproteobacteria bacterium]